MQNLRPHYHQNKLRKISQASRKKDRMVTLDGCWRQLGSIIQPFPVVSWPRNAFFWITTQCDVTTNIQRTLNSAVRGRWRNCYNRRWHGLFTVIFSFNILVIFTNIDRFFLKKIRGYRCSRLIRKQHRQANLLRPAIGSPRLMTTNGTDILVASLNHGGYKSRHHVTWLNFITFFKTVIKVNYTVVYQTTHTVWSLFIQWMLLPFFLPENSKKINKSQNANVLPQDAATTHKCEPVAKCPKCNLVIVGLVWQS